MNKLFGPVQIAAIAVAVLGALVRQPALVALGVVAWFGSVAIASIKDATHRSVAGDQAQGETVLRPIQRLHREIEALVLQNPDNPTVSVIGRDALAESQELLKRAIALSVLIRDTRQTREAMDRARQELDSLRSNRATQASEALDLAIEARESEIAHYSKVQATVESAKARLAEAEIALSAIRAQLAAAVAGGATEGLETEGLSGMVGRLKSLSTSLDEVEEMKERT
jgi:hypothetical protein